MIKISKLVDPADVWIYQNFLDNRLHQTILSYLDNSKNDIISNEEGRQINYDSKSYRIKNTNEKHPYHLLWYLPYLPDYWNQTNQTIVKWANNHYRQVMHPAVRFLVDNILSTKPFSDSPDEWVVIRGVFNLLEPHMELWPHTDGAPMIIDTMTHPTYSASYYASVEGNGGEFWDDRGFVYKPTNNSLLINIGSKDQHGVRASDQYRMGLTVRVVKASDLTLPGSVDQLLYKPTT